MNRAVAHAAVCGAQQGDPRDVCVSKSSVCDVHVTWH